MRSRNVGFLLRPDVSLVPGWPLALATALLLILSFPPFSNPVAPFLALAPVSAALGRASAADPRWAFRFGLTVGAVAWGWLMAWIAWALVPLTPLSVPLYVVTAGFLACLTGVFGWSAFCLHRSASLPLWLAVPLGWVAVEWLRAHLGPLSFPWLELGVSLAPRPWLAGAAELVGTRGLSFWLALVASGATAAYGVRGARRIRITVATGIALLLPAAWGGYRHATLELVPLATVALVQPDLSRGERSVQGTPQAALRRLESLHARLPPGIDLVVWPEAVFTRDPRSDIALDSALSALVDGVGAPVFFGTYLRGAIPSGGRVTFNGALAWLPGSGDAGYAYRKRRLVPGVEAVPFVDPAGPGVEGRFVGFGRGRDAGVLALPGLPALSPLICYEATFSEAALAAARAGGELLVNLTNDAWLGGGDGSRPSAALRQHPAHLVLRALELRQSAVRAANTGISLFVDPLGRVSGATEVFEPDVRVGVAYGVRGTTLYARLGDVVGTASALLAALALAVAWTRHRRSARSRQAPVGRGAPTGRDAPG